MKGKGEERMRLGGERETRIIGLEGLQRKPSRETRENYRQRNLRFWVHTRRVQRC